MDGLVARKMSTLSMNSTFFERRALALVAGAMVTGGTALYCQTRIRRNKHDSFKFSHEVATDVVKLSQNGVDNNSTKRLSRKKGSLRSLHVLTAILLSKLGPYGLRTILALVTTAVLRTALSNRLAKVQVILKVSLMLILGVGKFR
ncbi:hypothetical protein HPP92_016105 [Vanilla planifolia]|uniref:Uncharacterized protein n=1 Tax=Vanilla planifolia TaxID=51239 RepID=A0A835UQY2_VANPL|nr:hypothetical protein HPP92_016105 [Vanilla planifolia]